MPQSYLDFTLRDLEKMFGIRNKSVSLGFNSAPFIEPTAWLHATLNMSRQMPLGTEKAKSELIVTPILLELFNRNPQFFKYFSGFTFDVDKSKSLTGRCDYLLTKDAESAHISAPIISIFEAKNDNLDDWLGQCGAEMYASYLFNQRENQIVEVIHGAVTNGFEWLFMKLENNILLIDIDRYGLANLPQLLGVMQKMIDFYK